MNDLIFDYALVKAGEYFTGVIKNGVPVTGEKHQAYTMTAFAAFDKLDNDPRYKGFTAVRVS